MIIFTTKKLIGEWVIMRVDIKNAISMLEDVDTDNYKPEILDKILCILKEY